LRRILADTLSSRLDNIRFQILSGFTLRGFRVLPRLGLAPNAFGAHPIRIVQASLGAHLRRIILVELKSYEDIMY